MFGSPIHLVVTSSAVAPVVTSPSSVLVRSRGSDAGDDGPKPSPEGLRQEGVEDGVDARVGVGQDVTDDLEGHLARRHGRVETKRPQHQDHLPRTQ